MSKHPMRTRLEITAGSMLCLAMLASPAFAQDHDDHHDRDEHHDRDDRARQHYDHPAYHFRTEDRERMYGHYRDSDQWRDRRDRHEYYEGQRWKGTGKRACVRCPRPTIASFHRRRPDTSSATATAMQWPITPRRASLRM